MVGALALASAPGRSSLLHGFAEAFAVGVGIPIFCQRDRGVPRQFLGVVQGNAGPFHQADVELCRSRVEVGEQSGPSGPLVS